MTIIGRLLSLFFCLNFYTSIYSQTQIEIKEKFYNLPLDSTKKELFKIVKSDSNFIRIPPINYNINQPINSTILIMLNIDSNIIKNQKHDSIINFRAYIKNPYAVSFPPDSSKIEINQAKYSEYIYGKHSEYQNTIKITTTYFYSKKKLALTEYKNIIKKFAYINNKPGKVSGGFIEEGVRYQLNENTFLPYLNIYFCNDKISEVYFLMIEYQYYKE